MVNKAALVLVVPSGIIVAIGVASSVMSKSWTPIEAVGGVASALAIIATAIVALVALERTMYFERVKLTVGVLEANYTLEALQIVIDILAAHHQDLNASKQYVNAQNQPPGATGVFAGQQSRVVGTYAYIAGLYHRDILDRDTLLAKDYLTAVLAFYIFHDVFMRTINLGVMPPTVLDLGRDALALVKRNPAIFAVYPMLQNYQI